MRSWKAYHTVIILMAGIVIGFVAAFAIALLNIHAEGGKSLIGVRTFGDIKVWTQRPLEIEGNESHQGDDIYKMLVMAKDDIPFLVISRDKQTGEVTFLGLLNDKKEPFFSMKPLNVPGKWGQTLYCGHNKAGNITGESFIDIDLDGHFDVKNVFDDSGKRVSTYIHIDAMWKQVDHCNTDGMVAVLEQTKYTFDAKYGWQKE